MFNFSPIPHKVSGRKKMSESGQTFESLRRYLPAVLRQNSMGWYIEYYAYNQVTKSLERKRMRVNRERKKSRTFAEFRALTNEKINFSPSAGEFRQS